MLKLLCDVSCCTHDPRHQSSFIPVIVSGKEYPKGTCLAPRFIIMGDKVSYCFILKQFFSNILMYFQKDLNLRMHQKFDNYQFTFDKGLPS